MTPEPKMRMRPFTEPRAEPLWPFASFGKYRLELVAEGTFDVPQQVRADETPELAKLLRLVLARESPRPLLGAVFVDPGLRVTGYTVGEMELAARLGGHAAGIFRTAWLRGAEALVVFQTGAVGAPIDVTPGILEFAEGMVTTGPYHGVEVLDYLLLGRASQHLSLRGYTVSGWSWPAPPRTLAVPALPEGADAWSERKLRIKYRLPEDVERRWAGTGTVPDWLVDELAAGRPLEELLLVAPAGDEELASELASLARRIGGDELDLATETEVEALREAVRRAAAAARRG